MNWIKFFRNYNIPYKLGAMGKITCNCPLHSPKDVDYFMLVYPNGTGTCWLCGKHKVYDIIKGYTNLDDNAVRKVYQEYKDGINVKSYTPPNSSVGGIPPLSIQLPGNGLNSVELDYLHNRGVTNQQIDKYNLIGGGIAGYFQYRIIIPIYDSTGKLISARGRNYTNNPLRYKALKKDDEIIPHKKVLYNEQFVNGDTIILVEGEFDAIAGGDGFVASFGTSVTDSQIIKLSKYKRVIICFDSDYAGQYAADNIGNNIATLSNSIVESILISSKYKDLGDTPKELLQEIKKSIYGN